MLYNLVRNAAQTLLFRYQEAQEYRYSLPAAAAVLLLLGLQLAAAWSPFFGNSHGIIAFFIISAVLKWLILSSVMSSMLHYFGAPKMNLRGFILATEALSIPLLLLFYLPAMIVLTPMWQFWTFWAQAVGLLKMSKVNGIRLLLCYLVYSLLMAACSFMILMLFISAGWIDVQSIQKLSETLMAPKP